MNKIELIRRFVSNFNQLYSFVTKKYDESEKKMKTWATKEKVNANTKKERREQPLARMEKPLLKFLSSLLVLFIVFSVLLVSNYHSHGHRSLKVSVKTYKLYYKTRRNMQFWCVRIKSLEKIRLFFLYKQSNFKNITKVKISLNR